MTSQRWCVVSCEWHGQLLQANCIWLAPHNLSRKALVSTVSLAAEVDRVAQVSIITDFPNMAK